MSKKPKILSQPNPVLVFNEVTNRYLVTTDSTKSYYRANKGIKLMRKIQNEIDFNQSPYHSFVTLTYDNDHLPLVTLDERTPVFFNSNKTPKPCTVLSPFNFQPEDVTDPREIFPITDAFSQDIQNGLYAPAWSKPQHSYLKNNFVGVLNKRDLTLFFKRFRMMVVRHMTKVYRAKAYADFEKDTSIHLPKTDEYDFNDPSQVYKYKYNYSHEYNKIKKDEKLFQRYLLLRTEVRLCSRQAKSFYQSNFQYLAVGEYGGHIGQHSRPHFHILFLCKQELAYEILCQFCYKAWQKCNENRCTVELVRSSVSSYISSYSSCMGDYPLFFKGTKYQPFARVSRGDHAFGSPNENLLSLIKRFINKDVKRESFYSRSNNPLVRTVSKYNSKLGNTVLTDIVVSKNVLNRYFAFPRGFARMDLDAKRNLYRKSLQVLQGEKKLFPSVRKKTHFEACLDAVELGQFRRLDYDFTNCAVGNFTDCNALSCFINFLRSDFSVLKPILHGYESLFDDLIEVYIEIQSWLHKQFNLYLNEVHFNDVGDYFRRTGRNWIDQSAVFEVIKNFSHVDFKIDPISICKNYSSGFCGPFVDLYIRFLSVGFNLEDYYEVVEDNTRDFYKVSEKDLVGLYHHLDPSDYNNFFMPSVRKCKSVLKSDNFGQPLILQILEDTSDLQRWALEQEDKARKIKSHTGRHSNHLCGSVNDE